MEEWKMNKESRIKQEKTQIIHNVDVARCGNHRGNLGRKDEQKKVGKEGEEEEEGGRGYKWGKKKKETS